MPELTFEAIDARVREYMQASLNKGLELARFMPGDTVDTNAEVVGLRDDIKRLRDQLASPDLRSRCRQHRPQPPRASALRRPRFRRSTPFTPRE